jgi:hypothetical protein
LIRREAELQALRGRLDDANQKYRASTEQVVTVKERLTQQEAASKIAEENLAQTLPGWKKCEAVWPKNIGSFSRKLLA